jgi:acetate kinase
MGLTPTGGVVMGTRCGDIDPGVMLYLMREKRADAAWIEQLVDHRSGLLGISGIDGDMRRLHEVAATNADARLAIDIFCYSVRKQIAAMIAVLDGIDLLVFTGGIGERDPIVRASICGGLSWQGILLDPESNETLRDSISVAVSRCPVRVLPAEEDVQIALHTRTLIEEVAA